MTADIHAIHCSERTSYQQDVINAAAEVVADMSDVMGYAIVIWDGTGTMTVVEPWPHSPLEMGELVKEAVEDFFVE